MPVPNNCTTPECAGAELLQPEEDPPTTEEQKMDHFVSIWLTHEVISFFLIFTYIYIFCVMNNTQGRQLERNVQNVQKHRNEGISVIRQKCYQLPAVCSLLIKINVPCS